MRYSPPTACRCMVSGSLNSLNKGSFHRSVTILFAIGRRVVLSLGGWTPLLHTEFHELRATLERQHRVQVFTYRTITFYGSAFQQILLTVPLLMSAPATPSTYFWPVNSSEFSIRRNKCFLDCPYCFSFLSRFMASFLQMYAS